MKVIKLLTLIIIVALVAGCEQLLIEENSDTRNVEDFETTWQTINEIYPLLEFKNIEWDSVYTIYKPLAEKSKGDEIYTILFDMLNRLKDGHIKILTKGGWPISTYTAHRYERDKNSYNPLVIRNYFSKELRLAGQYKMEYEYLTSELGYVYISTFSNGDWKYDFDKVLQYFSGSEGLIIDIRNNSGGSGSTFYYMLSKFLRTPIIDTAFYTDGARTYIINPDNSNQYLKPVVILINGTSASAAEMFPSLMKNESNVTLIGDTTAGLGGNTYLFDLPSRKRIQIIDRYYKSYNNVVIEWNGVAPDIRVEQTESDIRNGVDNQLEYARDYLNEIIK
jgi:hypothetical protein